MRWIVKTVIPRVHLRGTYRQTLVLAISSDKAYKSDTHFFMLERSLCAIRKVKRHCVEQMTVAQHAQPLHMQLTTLSIARTSAVTLRGGLNLCAGRALPCDFFLLKVCPDLKASIGHKSSVLLHLHDRIDESFS